MATDYLLWAIRAYEGEDVDLTRFQGGPFSAYQLSAIAHRSRTTVRKYVTKGSKTGGALNPESLRDIRDVRDAYASARAASPARVKAIVDAGTGYVMLSTLTGISVQRLRTLYGKGTHANNLLYL